MDLYLAMRAVRLARPDTVFQPDATVSTQTRRLGPRTGCRRIAPCKMPTSQRITCASCRIVHRSSGFCSRALNPAFSGAFRSGRIAARVGIGSAWMRCRTIFATGTQTFASTPKPNWQDVGRMGRRTPTSGTLSKTCRTALLFGASYPCHLSATTKHASVRISSDGSKTSLLALIV